MRLAHFHVPDHDCWESRKNEVARHVQRVENLLGNVARMRIDTVACSMCGWRPAVPVVR